MITQRPLMDVCLRITDGTHQSPAFVADGIPFLFSSNIVDGRISFATEKFISHETMETLTKGCPIQVGDVLYTAVGSYGRAAVVENGRKFAFQRHLAHLKPNLNKIDPSFLKHFLNSPVGRAQADRVARGVAQKTVTLSDLKEFKVFCPSLAEQRRIAAILDQADALRAKRRAVLAQLDEMARAIFVEMFGDVVVNSAKWPERDTLGKHADIASGITKGRRVPSDPVRSIPYLAVANVQDRRLNLSTVKTIEASEKEIVRYRLKLNDLLLTEGGDPDKLGRGALWNAELNECIHQNHVFRVRVFSTINPKFLSWLIASQRGKEYFFKSAKQTTGIASINMNQLRAFPLLMPPLALQDEFEKRLTQLDTLKAVAHVGLAETDALFASLQNRAFAGEL